jgi:putative membrane protein
MRWMQTIVIAVVAVATLIFAVQNLQSVTVSFLNFQIGAPLAILVVIIYLLGMVTGGSAWALMRWALQGSRQA